MVEGAANGVEMRRWQCLENNLSTSVHMFTATAGANLHAGVDFSLILVDSDSLMMQCIEDNLSIWHLHTAVDFDDVATPMIKVSTPIIFNMACCICHFHVGFFVGVQVGFSMIHFHTFLTQICHKSQFRK